MNNILYGRLQQSLFCYDNFHRFLLKVLQPFEARAQNQPILEFFITFVYFHVFIQARVSAQERKKYRKRKLK